MKYVITMTVIAVAWLAVACVVTCLGARDEVLTAAWTIAGITSVGTMVALGCCAVGDCDL